MIKKIISITTILILTFTTFFSTVCFAKNNEIFGSDIVLTEDISIEKPIATNSSQSVELTVKYKLNLENLSEWFYTKTRVGRAIMFGVPYFFKIINKDLPKAKVTLSIAEKPEDCEVKLDQSLVEFDFDNQFQSKEFKLTYIVNKTKPAFEINNIKIQANFVYDGNGSLKSASNTTIVSFRSAYEPKLDINATTEIAIPPLNESKIPINLKNLGNGETLVNVEIEGDIPKGWNISIENANTTIPILNLKQVKMFITPPKDFVNETIKLKFTTSSTSKEDISDEYLKGDVSYFSFNISNDGSLKEEEDNGIINFAVVIVVILILIITGLFIFLKRKK